MLGWFKKRNRDEPTKGGDGLRVVPGAGVYRDSSGQVMYNLLDPIMQQFLGRCVGAVKKAGIQAKGTGSFSLLLGEDQKAELPLDQFWREFANSQDAGGFLRVVEVATKAVSKEGRNCDSPSGATPEGTTRLAWILSAAELRCGLFFCHLPKVK